MIANIIWCTGFGPGFDWIDLPVFGSDGTVRHQSGVVESHPGLYFVGLHFLHAMSSSMVHGVGRDAARIVRAIGLRVSAGRSQQRAWSAG
jgi:putative flavoprotein involved in K+ transport